MWLLNDDSLCLWRAMGLVRLVSFPLENMVLRLECSSKHQCNVNCNSTRVVEPVNRNRMRKYLGLGLKPYRNVESVEVRTYLNQNDFLCPFCSSPPLFFFSPSSSSSSSFSSSTSTSTSTSLDLSQLQGALACHIRLPVTLTSHGGPYPICL